MGKPGLSLEGRPQAPAAVAAARPRVAAAPETATSMNMSAAPRLPATSPAANAEPHNVRAEEEAGRMSPRCIGGAVAW